MLYGFVLYLRGDANGDEIWCNYTCWGFCFCFLFFFLLPPPNEQLTGRMCAFFYFKK